jgi:hypothetical protein
MSDEIEKKPEEKPAEGQAAEALPQDTPPPDAPSNQPDASPAAIIPPPSGPEMTLDEALSKQANKKRKGAGGGSSKANSEKMFLYGTIGVFLLVVVLIIYSCQPQKGSLAFGICSAFLELNTPYPHTLNFTDVEGSRTAVRIYFTSVDPFGQFRQEMLECTFAADEQMGMKLAQVARNRRPVDAEVVKEFNLTLPTIMASDPYLVLPPNWKNPLVHE